MWQRNYEYQEYQENQGSKPMFMKEPEEHIEVIPKERIINKIYWLRGQRVMFDADLADLYGVETKVLNQAVKRNSERFPDDFMFCLNQKEMEIFSGSRSQIVTLKEEMRSQIVTASKRNVRFRPYAFTEQGVAMLSSVLKSKRAVAMNIHIIRVFTKMREMLLTHAELRGKIEQMERKYDKQFRIVFDALKEMLVMKEESSKREIGF